MVLTGIENVTVEKSCNFYSKITQICIFSQNQAISGLKRPLATKLGKIVKKICFGTIPTYK